jgi:hypothetical protein
MYAERAECGVVPDTDQRLQKLGWCMDLESVPYLKTPWSVPRKLRGFREEFLLEVRKQCGLDEAAPK